MKITESSHKAYGGSLGGALAAILVYIARLNGLDLGPIGDPIALVLTMAIGGFAGTWFAPGNQPRPRKEAPVAYTRHEPGDKP